MRSCWETGCPCNLTSSYSSQARQVGWLWTFWDWPQETSLAWLRWGILARSWILWGCYSVTVWWSGVEGFSETLCGGLSENGLHTIYLNVWPPVGRAVWKGFWWCGLVSGGVSLEVGFEVSNTHGIPSLPPLSLSSLTPFLCLAVDQDAIAQLWLQCRVCLPVTVLHILLPSRTMSLCLTFKLLKCSEKTPWPRQPVEEKAHWGLSSWSTSTRQKERVRERGRPDMVMIFETPKPACPQWYSYSQRSHITIRSLMKF